MEPEFINSNYQLIWREPIKNIDDFNKLLNWMSGEFILYQQQEQTNGLKVFLPNGWFQIALIEGVNYEYEVTLKSKSKQAIALKYNRIISVIDHLKRFNRTLLEVCYP
tara:strand:+ start:27055 stop:27378 length:324 start_codon:yes stop_codon:yes gene_type:complete